MLQVPRRRKWKINSKWEGCLCRVPASASPPYFIPAGPSAAPPAVGVPWGPLGSLHPPLLLWLVCHTSCSDRGTNLTAALNSGNQPFTHLAAASDFGAIRNLDLHPTTAAQYRSGCCHTASLPIWYSTAALRPAYPATALKQPFSKNCNMKSLPEERWKKSDFQ